MSQNVTKMFYVTNIYGDEICIHVKDKVVIVQVASGRAPLRQHPTIIIKLEDIRRIGFIYPKDGTKTLIISSSYNEEKDPIVRIDGIFLKDVTHVLSDMIDVVISRL